MLDPARVQPDEEMREVLQHPLHRQFAPGDAALAEPVIPSSVSILTMKQLRCPTLTGKPLIAVIFMVGPHPPAPLSIAY